MSVLVWLRREPGARRLFRMPAAWVIAPLAIFGCVDLFTSLSGLTPRFFVVWNAFGLLIYFSYARRRALA